MEQVMLHPAKSAIVRLYLRLPPTVNPLALKTAFSVYIVNIPTRCERVFACTLNHLRIIHSVSIARKRKLIKTFLGTLMAAKRDSKSILSNT